jgi:hypothetical protein
MLLPSRLARGRCDDWMDCEWGEGVEYLGRTNGVSPGSIGTALGMGGVVPCPAGGEVEAKQSRGQSATFESNQLSHTRFSSNVSLSRLFVFLQRMSPDYPSLRIEGSPYYREGQWTRRMIWLLTPPCFTRKNTTCYSSMRIGLQ